MKKTAIKKRRAREKRDSDLINYLTYVKNYGDGVIAYRLQKEKQWNLGRVLIAMLNSGWSLEKTCRACKDAGNGLEKIVRAYWENEHKEGHPSISDLFTMMVKGGIADRTILTYCKNAGMSAYFVSALCLNHHWSQERASRAFLEAGWKYVATNQGEISIIDDHA